MEVHRSNFHLSGYGRYVSNQNAPKEYPADLSSLAAQSEVDRFGVPLLAFGRDAPPQFFEILGRLLAINGKIEYLKERLGHLPPSELSGVRKVEQFFKRYDSGRLDRNAIVHSTWVFGAHTKDPEVIVGIRYKISKANSGQIAMVSIRDTPNSERKQVFVQYKLDELRELLKRDVATLLIGERAYATVNLKRAAQQPPESAKGSTEPLV